MGRMRLSHAGLGIVCACAGLVAATSSTAAGPGLSANLAPTSAATVPLGDAFTLRAIISSGQAESGTVLFSVRPAAGGTTVPFDSQDVQLGPGQTLQLDLQVTTSKWFAGAGPYEVLVTLDGQPLAAPLAFTVAKARVAPAVFEDVSPRLGLGGLVPEGLCFMQVAGAAWGDVNGDGKLDLFFPRGNQPAALFVNRGKQGFVDEASARGVAGDGTLTYGAVFADYDNDGHPDLYLTREGPDVLYHNDGTGHFRDVTATAGVGGGMLSHRSAAWGDYDNDGRLDLYVTTYSPCFAAAQPDQLFHNDGNGRFTDVSSLVQPDYGLFAGRMGGRGFQAAWFDYNRDGRQDLYVANDFLRATRDSDSNRLWRNDGRGPDGKWHFTDVSAESHAGIAVNSMGIGIGDYDRDGRLDLAISNVGPNWLLHNQGDGTFKNTAGETGAAAPYLYSGALAITWGTIFGDFNLDGWEDLYAAAGYIEHDAEAVPQRNELLMNDHGKRFLDIRTPSHADDPARSRGVATADYDRDGRLDLIVVDQPGTIHLYRNVTARAKQYWLEVRTRGTRSNRDGCGARVTVAAQGGTQVREVFCGSVGLGSGSDTVVHFGLASAKVVSRLTVSWPSGVKQVLRQVKADRLATVTEPKV
jgi:hypothetical protein